MASREIAGWKTRRPLGTSPDNPRQSVQTTASRVENWTYVSVETCERHLDVAGVKIGMSV